MDTKQQIEALRDSIQRLNEKLIVNQAFNMLLLDEIILLANNINENESDKIVLRIKKNLKKKFIFLSDADSNTGGVGQSRLSNLQRLLAVLS